MTGATTQFLVLDHTLKAMGITSDKNEDAIKEIIFDANIEANKVMLPYADNMPLPPEAERTEHDIAVFERGRSLALAYVRWKWFVYAGQVQWADKYKEEYDEKLASLVEVFKARRGVRTKRVISTTQSTVRRLYSQEKRYG